MVIWEVLGKSSVALPCFPDKLAVQRGSRCGTVDAAGPGSPGVSWEHGAGGLGDSLGHPPPGQAGASVVGPSLRCCVPLPHPECLLPEVAQVVLGWCPRWSLLLSACSQVIRGKHFEVCSCCCPSADSPLSHFLTCLLSVSSVGLSLLPHRPAVTSDLWSCWLQCPLCLSHQS